MSSRPAHELARLLKRTADSRAERAIGYVANDFGTVVGTNPLKVEAHSNGMVLDEDDLIYGASGAADLVKGDTVLLNVIGNVWCLVAAVGDAAPRIGSSAPLDAHAALTENVHGLPNASAGQALRRNTGDTAWEGFDVATQAELDTHISDASHTNARSPTAHKATHEPGGSDAMAVDAAAGTGSLRSLGTGAQQATKGTDRRFTMSEVFVTVNGGWTNMPAALTEVFSTTQGRGRRKVDLTDCLQVRLISHVAAAGTAASKLRGRFSTDGGTNWSYLDGGTGPEVSLGSTGSKDSGWLTLVAAARADVLVQLWGLDGDGVADPDISFTKLEFR